MTLAEPTPLTRSPVVEADRNTSSRVRARQLELLSSQANAGTATFLVNAAIACGVLWPVTGHARLMGWYALVMLLAALRIALATAFGRQTRVGRGEPRWLAMVMGVSVATGVLWGVAGIFLVPPDSHLHHMFMAMLLAGMTAGALPLLSAIWEVYLLYALPALLPFSVWLWAHPDPLHQATGAMVAIFLAMMLFASRRHFVVLDETLRLRFENEQLQQNLHDAAFHAEIAAEELQAEMADRRRAQAALWRSEARFQRLVDQAGDAFFLVDLEGRVCEVNQQACDSLGFTYQELVTSSAYDLFAGLDDAFIEHAWQKVFTERTVTLDLVHRRKDGTTFPVEARVSLFESGDERFVLALIRDVSERKKVERLRNEFVSTVSHELRTPLTCIHASLAVLRGEQLEPLPEASREMVDIAYKNGEQLIRLINDLLDIQKMESDMLEFRFEALPVLTLVEEAVATSSALAEREGVRLEIVGADDGAVVWADRGRLLQVVGNLLSNAIKFSGFGEIVELAVLRADGVVRVEVRDRGPGIPEDFRDKVFQKFTQADASDVRQRGGTGLGLSICQMIVERLQGRIGFESEVGAGSTFWFELEQFRG